MAKRMRMQLPLATAVFVALALVQETGAAVCDLSGEWLLNHRVGGGGNVPASLATSITVKQAADGSFTASCTGSCDQHVTNWTTRLGSVNADRHVETWLPTNAPWDHHAEPNVQLMIGRKDTLAALLPTTDINCTTEAECKATCKGSGTSYGACSTGVYYCCGKCNGVYTCPTNSGLADCACNPPPPTPLNRTRGTVQPSCKVVMWECGEPITGSCEGASPLETWHKVDRDTKHVHVVYFSHFDAGYTHDTSLEVLDQYFSSWFPKAFNVSRQLRARGGQEQFHWTTHPWLITQLFANATGNVTHQQINGMEEAINEGLISWQAAPMNLQAETARQSPFT